MNSTDQHTKIFIRNVKFGILGLLVLLLCTFFIARYYINKNVVQNAKTYDEIFSTVTELVSDPSIYEDSIYEVGVNMPAGEYIIFSNDIDRDINDDITSSFKLYSKNPDELGDKSDPDNDEYFSNIIASNSVENNFIITVANGNFLTLENTYAVPFNEVIHLNGAKSGYFKVGTHLPQGKYQIQPNKIDTICWIEVFSNTSRNDNAMLFQKVFDKPVTITVYNDSYLNLGHCYISDYQVIRSQYNFFTTPIFAFVIIVFSLCILICFFVYISSTLKRLSKKQAKLKTKAQSHSHNIDILQKQPNSSPKRVYTEKDVLRFTIIVGTIICIVVCSYYILRPRVPVDWTRFHSMFASELTRHNVFYDYRITDNMITVTTTDDWFFLPDIQKEELYKAIRYAANTFGEYADYDGSFHIYFESLSGTTLAEPSMFGGYKIIY